MAEFYVLYSLRPYHKKLYSRISADSLYAAKCTAMRCTGGFFALVLFKKEFDEFNEKYLMYEVTMSPTSYLIDVNKLLTEFR